MEELLLEMSKVIGQVGLAGLWVLVLCKVLGIIKIVSILLVIFYGVGKAWPHIERILNEPMK